MCTNLRVNLANAAYYAQHDDSAMVDIESVERAVVRQRAASARALLAAERRENERLRDMAHASARKAKRALVDA
jgi:hypothetical protein